jgi:hypothetical protein
MTVIDIDETTEAGQHILRHLAEHPEAGMTRECRMPRDENGVPIGIPWEEVRERMYNNLSKHYGVDLRTLLS